MSKITSLTPEQEAKIDVYCQEGIKIGLCTKRGDMEQIKEHVIKHREMVGLGPVKEWIELDSPITAVKKYGLSNNDATYGSQSIHWLQFYMFWRNEVGLVKETEQIVHLYELAKISGWTWWGNDVMVVTHKPSAIRMKNIKMQRDDGPIQDIKVLHNPGGMALEYADGTGVYALDGRRLGKNDQWIVTEPEKLTLENVLKIQNTDIRASALKLLPSDAVVNSPSAKIIDTGSYTSYHMTNKPLDPNKVTSLDDYLVALQTNAVQVQSDYELIKLEVDGQERFYLKMTCPSKKEVHVEAVDPRCQTVAAALGWKEHPHLPINDNYVPPVVRT